MKTSRGVKVEYKKDNDKEEAFLKHLLLILEVLPVVHMCVSFFVLISMLKFRLDKNKRMVNKDKEE